MATDATLRQAFFTAALTGLCTRDDVLQFGKAMNADKTGINPVMIGAETLASAARKIADDALAAWKAK